MLQVLDTESPLLIWAADRPFLIQLVAAFIKLGRALTLVTEESAGHTQITKIYPKSTFGLSVPETFVGNVVWAPRQALFSNSPLTPTELNEIASLESDARVEKLVLCLPQQSYGQLLARRAPPTQKTIQLFLPAVVGFGDRNYFESLLEKILSTQRPDRAPATKVISEFDVCAMVIALLMQKTLPKLEFWTEGTQISDADLVSGFSEVVSTNSGLQLWLRKKLQPAKFNFALHPSLANPDTATLADPLEVMPSGLSGWPRFLRDSWRVYKHTQDGDMLLHFPPSRGPA